MNQPSLCGHFTNRLFPILHSRPQAIANITGSESYPNLSGMVRFYQVKEGVIVYAEIRGLPQADAPCHRQIFGFHIHSGTDCSGNMDDSFVLLCLKE